MDSFNNCLKLDIGELLSSRFSKSNTPVKTSRQISSRPLFSHKTLEEIFFQQFLLYYSTTTTCFI